MDPQHANAYWNRGLVYQNGLRNRAQAIADYRAAYRLEPKNSTFAAKLRSLGVEPRKQASQWKANPSECDNRLEKAVTSANQAWPPLIKHPPTSAFG